MIIKINSKFYDKQNAVLWSFMVCWKWCTLKLAEEYERKCFILVSKQVIIITYPRDISALADTFTRIAHVKYPPSWI
jgi:hypothetical protein